MVTNMPSSPSEIARHAKELYEESIRAKVEARHRGKFLVIDVETGDYEIDEDHLAASDRAHARHPGGKLFALRIGFPAAGRLGGRLTPAKP